MEKDHEGFTTEAQRAQRGDLFVRLSGPARHPAGGATDRRKSPLVESKKCGSLFGLPLEQNLFICRYLPANEKDFLCVLCASVVRNRNNAYV